MDHPNLVTPLSNLAVIHQSKGDNAAAELLLKRSVDIMEKLYGPNSLQAADSLTDLANLYWSVDRIDEAEDLEIRVASLGEATQDGGVEMSFTVYITRKEASISLDEWKATVELDPNIRITTEDLEAISPQTGKKITIANEGGDAEVRNASTGEWERVFFFWAESGRVSFGADEGFDGPDSRLRKMARGLAKPLNAVVEDEYGTLYE